MRLVSFALAAPLAVLCLTAATTLRAATAVCVSASADNARIAVRSLTTNGDSTVAQPAPTPAAADSLATDSVGRSVQLGEATVKATRLVLMTKRDTVIYDIDALGAAAGDLLGDLIARMPGLELRDGTLFFNGKAVDRLKVNGTDFIRGDTQTALEVLPAYLVKHVKVYEAQTDEARITGLDDGVRERVVDVVLRKNLSGLWAGNASAGYGTADYYRLRAFLSNFSDLRRVTFSAGLTNTGEFQSVSARGDWSDNGAGSSSGQTTYMRPQLTGMWQNKKDEDNVPGWFRAEYRVLWDYRRNNYNMRNIEEQQLADGSFKSSAGDEKLRDRDRSWNASTTFTWRPFRYTHIQISPIFSRTSNDGRTQVRDGLWNAPIGETGRAPLDSLFAHVVEGWPAGMAASAARLEEQEVRDVYTYGQPIFVTQRLTPKNMRLGLRSMTTYTYRALRTNSLTTYNQYAQAEGQPDPLYNRYETTRLHDFSTQNFLDFDIPLPFLQSLRFTYGYEKKYKSHGADGYRLERLGGLWADPEAYLAAFGRLPDAEDWRAACRDADITLRSAETMRRHWVESKLSYKKGALYADAKGTLRLRREELDFVRGDFAPVRLDRRSAEGYANAKINVETDSAGKYRIDYTFSFEPAPIASTVTIPDTSDPQNILTGNPALKALRSHWLSFGYERVLSGGRMVSASAMWNKSRNDIAQRTTYDKLTGVSTSRPDNYDGRWSAGFSGTFVLPLDGEQRFLLRTGAGYDYNHAPYFVHAVAGDSYQSLTLAHGLEAGVHLNVRIDKFYATLSSENRLSHSRDMNVADSRLTVWGSRHRAELQYTLPADVELRTNVSVQQSPRFAGMGVAAVRTVWNLSLTRSFLRTKALSVKLEASDLLNQREKSSAWQTATASGSSYSATVGRFFMAHLVYRFSTQRK